MSEKPTIDPDVTGDSSMRRQSKRSHKAFQYTDVDSLALVHELQVHQIELEMQNEELERSRLEVDSLARKYRYLFDYAPIGYLTLDPANRVLEVNVEGTKLVGSECRSGSGRTFTSFLAISSRTAFRASRSSTLSDRARVSCDLELHCDTGVQHIHVEIMPFGHAKEATSRCNVAVLDITNRVLAENALRENERRIANLQQETAILQERNRLAREIHDTFSQSFAAILMQLNVTVETLTKNQTLAQSHLERAKELARASLVEARQYLHTLRPPFDLSCGLVPEIKLAASKITEGTGLRIRVDVYGDARELLVHTESNLIRIVQEALNNTVKHARATEARVSIEFEVNLVRLAIHDDGIGFDPTSGVGAMQLGLQVMRERAELLGGTFGIESRAGSGVVIDVAIPVSKYQVKEAL